MSGRYVWLVLLIVGYAALLVTYSNAPGALGFPVPDLAKIIFFHVPPAMLCTVFFLWAAIMGIRYVSSRKPYFDMATQASVEIGTLLCALATVTGMMFAKAQWGKYWEWDPRQTSILIQLLIYLAYFALRSAFTDQDRAAKVTATYAAFAFITVPFLVWVLPRVVAFTKHEGANQAVVGGQLDSTYRAIFWIATVYVFALAVTAYKWRIAALQIEKTREVTNGLASMDATDTRVLRPVPLHSDGRSEEDEE